MCYTSIDYIQIVLIYEFICKFSATAITVFKQLSMNCYQKILWMFHKGQSLCRQRSLKALFGAAKWCMRLGRITLYFVSLNTPVMIWVYPEPSTDLQQNLFSFKDEKCQQMVVWKLLEGQREQETKFPKKHFVSETTVLVHPGTAVVFHTQTLHFCKC